MSIEKELFDKFGMALTGAGVPDFQNGMKIDGNTVTGTMIADVTATAAELNVLDASDSGVVANDVKTLAGAYAAGLRTTDMTKLAEIDAAAVDVNAVCGASTPGAVMRAIRAFVASAEGTYTGQSVVIPAGAIVTNIQVESIVAWDAATSALLNVGSVSDPDKYLDDWSAKATAGTRTSLNSLTEDGITLLRTRQSTELTITLSLVATGTTTAGITTVRIEYQMMTAAEVAKMTVVKDA